MVEDVLHVLLRALDLRIQRLPPERLRVLRAGTRYHDLRRIGDARAAEVSRKVVLDLDAETHDSGVVEPSRDEADHMGAAPRDIAGLLRLKLLVLLPRTCAYAGLERRPRKPEVVLYRILYRKASVDRQLKVERLWRDELHFRRRVLHYRYGRGLDLVRKAVGVPDERAPAALQPALQLEGKVYPPFRLDARDNYVAGERERTVHVGTRRLYGHGDLRPLEANYRSRVRIGVRRTGGVLRMAYLDLPLGIARFRHYLDPVRPRQRAAAAYAVVEALRNARIGERIYHRPLRAFLGDADHSLHRLALAVEARAHEGARREALAHREPERKRRPLEHDLVAGSDLERRSVNVVDLGSRDERARRKAKRRVGERGEKENKYPDRDCGGDEARLDRPSRELLLRRNRLDVLHGVLGDLLHEPRRRCEVARLRELHYSGETFL